MTTSQILNHMKQMIVVNDSLGLSEETWVAQVACASIGAFIESGLRNRKAWLKEGRPRTVLSAFDEKDLRDLLSNAERLKLPVYLVGEQGRAASPTDTLACLGIGPAPDAQIDKLTGVLNFYRWVRQNVM